jgi:hypothetical protein
MANVKVSSAFSKFMSKNAKAVEEAKTAENTMMTCKMPVGWKGNCVCVGAEADKGKDRKDDKGNTQEGREYVRLEFSVVNDEEYAGAKFSTAWSFFDSEKASAVDRFGWMLNEMENMGLPGEIRRAPDTTMDDILGHFINSDTVYEAEVVHNSYRRGDQKEVKVRMVEAIDGSTSMAPTAEPTPTPEAGSDVQYMGKSWELVDADGDDLVIKSKTTGQTRNIKASDLD